MQSSVNTSMQSPEDGNNLCIKTNRYGINQFKNIVLMTHSYHETDVF
ncbi:MAG: hypothetical protein ACYTXA_01065 [Nostoc sp.]